MHLVWRHAAVIAILIAMGACRDRSEKPPPEPQTTPVTVGGSDALDEPTVDDYAIVQKKLSQRVHAARRFAEAQPESAARAIKLSTTLLSRGRFTGEPGDLKEAGDVLDGVPERARHSRWRIARASVHAALHENEAALGELDQVGDRLLEKSSVASAVAGLRGNLALQAGEYEKARNQLQEAVSLQRTPTSLARLAHFRAVTGDVDDADAMYVAALDGVAESDGRQRAWLHLQRAVLDLERGDYEASAEHLRTADAELPGWWLVEEHLGEVEALLGNTEAAVARYRSVVASSDNPAFRVALAELVPDERERLLAEARDLLTERLEKYPASARGHAIDVIARDDPARALELARRDAEARPGGAAKSALAAMLLENCQMNAALETALEVTASPFVSRSAHAVASVAAAELGKEKLAVEHREKAVALHPTIFDDVAAPKKCP